MVQSSQPPVLHPDLEYLRRKLKRGSPRSPPRNSRLLARREPCLSLEDRVLGEISARRDRDQRFGSEFFSDSVWDMLLALYLAHLQSRNLSAADLCIASCAPAQVALRWISVLARKQLLHETIEPFDCHRMRIGLSRKAIDQMDEHFENAAG